MRKDKGKFFYAIFLGSLLGFYISAILIFFLLIGFFLDRKLQTFPWFLIFGSVLGMLVVFYEIKRLILPFLEKGRKNKK